MSGEAKELRELAGKIEQVAVKSRSYSMVAPAVQSLLDYLCLRARLMELEAERDDLRVDLKRERAVTDGNR
jgi:hypothetical protein